MHKFIVAPIEKVPATPGSIQAGRRRSLLLRSRCDWTERAG
jgi:hypothetical protein